MRYELRSAKDRSQQKAKAKLDKELEGGRKELEDKQYEVAKVFAEEAIKAYESYKKYNGKDGAQEIVLEATKLRFVAVCARIGRKLVSASLL